MSHSYRIELCSQFAQIGEAISYTFDGYAGHLKPGEWTLTAPSQAIGGTDPRAVDSIIVRSTETDDAVYAGVMRSSTTEARLTETVQDDGFMYQWQGTDLFGMLAIRIVFPSPATDPTSWADAYDTNTGAASTVAAQYLSDHIGPAALNGNRDIPEINVIDPAIGPTLTWDARLQRLDLLITAICEAGEIGLDTIWDTATSKMLYTFRTPVDLSASLVLSDTGDLESATITREVGSPTFVVGAGQGELAARTFRLANSAGPPQGFDRIEYLYENTNIADGDSLLTATAAKLAELNDRVRVDAIAASDGPNVPQWRTDYLLGDILGIEIGTVRLVAPVSGVKFSISADRSIIYPVFGSGAGNDLTSLIRRVDTAATAAAQTIQ